MFVGDADEEACERARLIRMFRVFAVFEFFAAWIMASRIFFGLSPVSFMILGRLPAPLATTRHCCYPCFISLSPNV